MASQDVGLYFEYEDMKVCCACALKDAIASGAPNLFFCANKPKRSSDSMEVCAVCGGNFCTDKVYQAAQEIIKLVSKKEGERWDALKAIKSKMLV